MEKNCVAIQEYMQNMRKEYQHDVILGRMAKMAYKTPEEFKLYIKKTGLRFSQAGMIYLESSVYLTITILFVAV